MGVVGLRIYSLCAIAVTDSAVQSGNEHGANLLCMFVHRKASVKQCLLLSLFVCSVRCIPIPALSYCSGSAVARDVKFRCLARQYIAQHLERGPTILRVLFIHHRSLKYPLIKDGDHVQNKLCLQA